MALVQGAGMRDKLLLVTAVAICTVVVACARDLAPGKAAEILSAHLRNVAETPLYKRKQHMDVIDVLQLSPTRREVRFKVSDTHWVPPLTDTTIYAAEFVRSSSGWGLANYSPNFATLVAANVYERLSAEYHTTIVALQKMRYQADLAAGSMGIAVAHAEMERRLATANR